MYTVPIEDSTGKIIFVEVSFEVFQVFEDEKRELFREAYEKRNHRDKRDRGLEDYNIENEALFPPEALEDQVFRINRMRAIGDALQACTPIQRERFYLHCVCGYSYAEIAHMLGCRKSAVWKSVAAAKKIVINFL